MVGTLGKVSQHEPPALPNINYEMEEASCNGLEVRFLIPLQVF